MWCGERSGVTRISLFYWRFATLRADLHPITRKSRVSGTPGLRRKEGIVSLLPRHLPFSSQKLASGPCRATTSRPASRDWNWARPTVWNPTLRKRREGTGHPRYGELRKERER